LCANVAVPCVFVAGGLMWYNYIRFGSVFEFGFDYQLSMWYAKSDKLMNPVAKLGKTIACCLFFLLPSFRVSASFPFFYLRSIDANIPSYGRYISTSSCMGLMAIPVVWFIFGIGKIRQLVDDRRKPFFYLLIAMICLGFLQLVSIALYISANGRYSVDFIWLFALSGPFCACFIYEGMAGHQRQMTGSVIYTAMIISVLLLFFTTMGGDGEGDALFWNNNPAVYYTIQRLLGFTKL